MNHGALSALTRPPVMQSNLIMVTIMIAPWVVSLQGPVSMTAVPPPSMKSKTREGRSCFDFWTSFRNYLKPLMTFLFSWSACAPYLAERSFPCAWTFPNENHRGASLFSVACSWLEWECTIVVQIVKTSIFKRGPARFSTKATSYFHW